MKKIIFVYVLLFLFGASLAFADNTPTYPPPTPYIYHIFGHDVVVDEGAGNLIFQMHRSGNNRSFVYNLKNLSDVIVHEDDGTYSKEFVLTFDGPIMDQPIIAPVKPVMPVMPKTPVVYGESSITKTQDPGKVLAPLVDDSFSKRYQEGSGLKRAYLTVKVGNQLGRIRQLVWVSPDAVSLPQPRPAAVPQ